MKGLRKVRLPGKTIWKNTGNEGQETPKKIFTRWRVVEGKVEAVQPENPS